MAVPTSKTAGTMGEFRVRSWVSVKGKAYHGYEEAYNESKMLYKGEQRTT